ncbi:hypothetical protein RFI_15711 [Reticulomyxa filosa]|uniref:Uncharacterized protein n=1 Tax=Reticulomyxa filosa TaxID=46433 RepID=X6N6E4_RETFI|nr:hypothetical protein RFI_15711 [Reticulomyxa filosa]|eukprot:ETO21493.1 hypothetical protein RFI_15711 [Reticulomyxa filosa]
MFAITEGDMNALQWLLEYCKEGIDWTYYSGERTYFHAIIDYFHRNTKGLKQLFYIVDQKDLATQFQMKDAVSKGKPPFMVCLDRNVSEDVIIRLLQSIKDINWKVVEPKIQRSHLHQICISCLKNEKQALQIIELLPDKAFEIQINMQDKVFVTKNNTKMIDETLIEKTNALDGRLSCCSTKSSHIGIVQQKKDIIDWSLKDQSDMTYFHFITRYYHHDLDTIKALCEQVIPKNQLKSQSESRDKVFLLKGKTPLDYAQDNEAPVEVLNWLKGI